MEQSESRFCQEICDALLFWTKPEIKIWSVSISYLTMLGTICDYNKYFSFFEIWNVDCELFLNWLQYLVVHWQHASRSDFWMFADACV